MPFPCQLEIIFGVCSTPCVSVSIKVTMASMDTNKTVGLCSVENSGHVRGDSGMSCRQWCFNDSLLLCRSISVYTQHLCPRILWYMLPSYYQIPTFLAVSGLLISKRQKADISLEAVPTDKYPRSSQEFQFILSLQQYCQGNCQTSHLEKSKVIWVHIGYI